MCWVHGPFLESEKTMSNRACPSVVLAVDGQPGSEGALRYAVDEAVGAGESLTLVHVWPGCAPQDLVPTSTRGRLEAAGRAVLDQSAAAAQLLAPNLDIATELVSGARAGGILMAARGGRLLVVGRSPRRVDSPFGGTPAALAARAEGPVVVVPASWTAGESAGRIVVAMKSRTHARELLSHAFAMSQMRGGAVEVVTAWELYDPTMDREEVRDHAAEWEAEGLAVLERLVAEWRSLYPEVPVGLRVIHGRSAGVLERASADADLLLLAKRLHVVPPYGRLGRTAHTLLRTSRCPVEVVPAGVVAAAPALRRSAVGRA